LKSGLSDYHHTAFDGSAHATIIPCRSARPGTGVAGLTMLELKDVSRSQGKDPVLVQASRVFSQGAPTSVLGLPASLRGVFLGLLSGAERPQSGTIQLSGQDVAQARKAKGAIHRIGPHGEKPSGRPVRKVIGSEAAARVGLSSRMDKAVKDLPPDERVRLSVAIAREAAPDLLLLDAPASGLAGQQRDDFTTDLAHMLAGLNSVIVLAAGAPDEARGAGGSVLVLEQGRIVQAGEASEVFAHPANLAAALATSWPVLNTLKMTARDGAGVLADGSTFQPPEGVVLPAGGACTLAFRPDDTRLERAGADCLRFIVRAAGLEEAGGRSFLRLSFAGSTWLAPKLATEPPQGVVLNAFVARSRLLVFDAEGRAIDDG
jgi:ABC-type sugar transport system ATPase subunit